MKGKRIYKVLAETLKNVYHFPLNEAFTTSEDILDILDSEGVKIPDDIPIEDVKPHDKMPDKMVYYKDKGRNKVGEISFTKLMTKVISMDPDVKPNEVNKIVIKLSDKFKHKFRSNNLFDFEIWDKPSKSYQTSKQICTGSLESSCMNDELNYLKMYDDHPDIKSLVMLTKDDKKIVARALVWNNILLNGSPVTFMDRIYTSKNEYEIPMKEYADKKGWVHRAVQHYDHKTDLEANGSTRQGTLLFYIPLDDYATWPYVDTMTYCSYNLEKKEFCLSNVPTEKLNQLYSKKGEITIEESKKIRRNVIHNNNKGITITESFLLGFYEGVKGNKDIEFDTNNKLFKEAYNKGLEKGLVEFNKDNIIKKIAKVSDSNFNKVFEDEINKTTIQENKIKKQLIESLKKIKKDDLAKLDLVIEMYAKAKANKISLKESKKYSKRVSKYMGKTRKNFNVKNYKTLDEYKNKEHNDKLVKQIRALIEHEENPISYNNKIKKLIIKLHEENNIIKKELDNQTKKSFNYKTNLIFERATKKLTSKERERASTMLEEMNFKNVKDFGNKLKATIEIITGLGK